MADINLPSDKREFRCEHCNGRILIPRDLPPTTGPCPHCGGTITSPALENAPPAPFPVPAAAPIPTIPITAAPPLTPPPRMSEAAATVPAPPTITSPPVPASITARIPAAETPAPTAPAPVTAQPPVAPEAPVAPPPQPVRPATIPPPRNAPAIEPPPTPKERAAAAKSDEPSTATTTAAEVSKTPTPSSKPVATKQPPRKSALLPVMVVLLLVILAAGAAVYFVTNEMGRNIPPPSIPATTGDASVRENNYLRVGWKKDAYQVLRDYMAATTAEGKLPHILNGGTLAPRIEDFYGGGVIDDSDTPADAFSVYELSEEDRKRGLFMMIYDQPPQFEMKEFFRPLAPLEVQYGLDEADLLLSTLARVGNFAMEPLRVHAFFKRTPDGLKLDWEVFAQTKYRTLQSFIELPESGVSGVFRVFIIEDVPNKNRTETGTRTYRIADPANTTDTARINVNVDSYLGRALSVINWRGTKEARPITRTATVELKWTGDPADPQLEISRFICWEFLGLGGQEAPPPAK